MADSVALYQIKRIFHAPLDFAYSWCTDYTEADPRLQGEKGSRQIIRRTSAGAIYEDLTTTPRGWIWSRYTVTFRPPNRWHATANGNYRTWSLDYSLRGLPDGRTEFSLRGKRRATPLGGKNPPKAVLEKELREMWNNLGKALEKDYRASRPQKSG